jgi:hypothetical protein
MNLRPLFVSLSVIFIIVIGIIIFRESLIQASEAVLKPTAKLLSQAELADKVVFQTYTSLDDALENPDDVYVLQLYDKSLTQFPEAIFKFRNLQYLNLGQNQIRVLPKDIYKLSLLQEIRLSNNQLLNLPPEIGRLKYLRRLELNGNHFGALPDEFQTLHKLRTLNLSENKFTEFPLVIGKLTGLEILDISSNQITDLPVQIEKLKRLTELNIKNNQLTVLPKEVFLLKNLQKLDVGVGQRDVVRGMIAKDPDLAHPVINGRLMALGGTVDRKWVPRSTINNCIFKGQKYRLYAFDRYLGAYENTADATEESDGLVKTNFNGAKDYLRQNVAFGVAGDWEVFPRKPLIKHEVTNEDSFLADFLKSKGIANPVIVIKKEIVVDLDGDGTDEALVVASNITAKDIKEFCGGNKEIRNDKYSLILLRRMNDGKEENLIVSGDFKQLMEHDISFVADIDHDQEMEFLDTTVSTEAISTEGFSVTMQDLYKLKRNKPEKIAEIFITPF